MHEGEKNTKSRTHSWTPGAVRVSPDEPLESLTSRTMLLAAVRHFSVLTSSVVSCLPSPVVVDADVWRKNLSRTLASVRLRARHDPKVDKLTGGEAQCAQSGRSC